MKPVRLILLPALASEPAPFLVIGAGGFVLERGALTLDAAVRPEPMRTVAVTPGADVVVRWLDLPAGGAAQLRAAAAWSLRGELAAPADRMTVALGPVVPAGEPRMVVAAGRALVEAWADYLEALGAPAEVMLPDVLTLEPPADGEGLSAVAFGPNVALRGERFAATVQSDLVELIAAGRPIVPLGDPAQVERALIAAALAPSVNLLSALGRERAATGGWRRAGALAAAVVLSPLVLVLAQAVRDETAARSMRAAARQTIVAAAPDLARATDPLGAFRGQVRAAPPPGGLAAATAALYAAVERIEGAELDILVADPGEGMKATLSHPDYQDVAVMRTALAPAGLTVEETGVADEGGRIVSDITVGAAR